MKLPFWERVASAYIDDPVTVRRVSHIPGGFGATSWRGDGWLIELCAPEHLEAQVVFHELGHIVLGHLPKCKPVDDLTSRQAAELLSIVMPREALAALREIEDMDKAADEWADAQLQLWRRVFARYGLPFPP